MVDRNTQGSARNRFDLLRGEAENLDIQTRQLTDALETLVRIQARYIYNSIFMTKTTHIEHEYMHTIHSSSLTHYSSHICITHRCKEIELSLIIQRNFYIKINLNDVRLRDKLTRLVSSFVSSHILILLQLVLLTLHA